MDKRENVDVFEWLDAMALNHFHAVLFSLCTFTLVLMGYSSQIVAYIIPPILKEWRITSVEAGSIASYTFLGLMIGAAGFGMVSDRIGRKRALILSLSVCGVFTGITHFAPDFSVLCLLRFLAGLGIGGGIPLVLTLGAEYAPSRNRARVLMIILAGFPVGWAMAALASMLLIPQFGWRVVLLTGGFLSLLLLPLLQCFLPESVRFLVGKKRLGEAIDQIRRIEKIAHLDRSLWDPRDFPSLSDHNGGSVRELFAPSYRGMTILLWMTYAFTMTALYGMATWLPQLLMMAGFSVARSYSYGLVQALGSLLGAFAIGFLLDACGRKSGLLMIYLLSGLSIIALGLVRSEMALYVVGFATGVFVLGAPNAVHVIAGETYPTHIRATGVGYGLAASRIGSILGPIIGGVLQMAGFGLTQFFILFSLPCFACMALICMYKVKRKGDVLETTVGPEV